MLNVDKYSFATDAVVSKVESVLKADQARPLSDNNCRRTRVLLRMERIRFNPSTVGRNRRVQFVPASVPGTLKRSREARRSVIITTAIQALLSKSALMIAG